MVDLSKIAYDAYAEHQGWRNDQGESISPWEEVRQDIKDAWRVAMNAAMKAWYLLECDIVIS